MEKPTTGLLAAVLSTARTAAPKLTSMPVSFLFIETWSRVPLAEAVPLALKALTAMPKRLFDATVSAIRKAVVPAVGGKFRRS